jgi:hypothetical protein
MNIFYLHPDPVVCAMHHCDKHVVKMILETAQLLSTAHRILDEDDNDRHDRLGLYKQTHKNHPSAVWVREAVGNYVWTHQLLISLCREYTHRYDKVHKTARLIGPLSQPPQNISTDPFRTAIPQCMPDQYKDHDPVVAYRRYYINDKRDIAQWNKTTYAPKWFNLPVESETQGMNSTI